MKDNNQSKGIRMKTLLLLLLMCTPVVAQSNMYVKVFNRTSQTMEKVYGKEFTVFECHCGKGNTIKRSDFVIEDNSTVAIVLNNKDKIFCVVPKEEK